MVRRGIRGVVDVERRVGWQTTDLVLTTEICGGRKKYKRWCHVRVRKSHGKEGH